MSPWQQIRLLRAKPPPIVTGERRDVFSSALEQAEQLMTAAEQVGYAARPLPLFYSLSQAGRAIAAARIKEDAWRLAGHGLVEPIEQASRDDLLRRTIRPQEEDKKALQAGRRTSFAGVAAAVGSDPLTEPIELGAVWAAIPDLMPPTPQTPGLEPNWPRPVLVYPTPDETDSPENAVLLNGRPLELLLGIDLRDAAGAGIDSFLADIERIYPGANGIAIPRWQGRVDLVCQWSPSGEFLPTFSWPDVRHPVKVEQMNAIAPLVRNDERMLLPRARGQDFLSPLMLWWVLLFGLSMLARYDPELWVAALSVNDSEQAVPIEATLDLALEALPHLIVQALTDR